MNLTTENNSLTMTAEICPLWRRFAAMLYDSILLSVVVLLAWLPVPLLPDKLSLTLGHGIRLAYLITICFLFFGWFWCHGGQTLGMRSWRIRLVFNPSSSPSSQSENQSETTFHAITWRIAWLRFIAAMLSWTVVGMGFIWSLFHHNKLTWHDIFSQTRLVVISKDRAK